MSTHDDTLDAFRHMIDHLIDWNRREALRTAFEGPAWVRMVEALSFSLITLAVYTVVIEVWPWAIRGKAVPTGMVFVVAGFFAAGLIVRGYLSDRARRFGGVYDGRFRVLE